MLCRFLAYAVALVPVLPVQAFAQNRVGPFVTASLSTSGEVAGVVAFQLDPRWAFGVELTYASAANSDGGSNAPRRSAHLTAFTPEVRMALPGYRRFAAYVVGGGGASSETIRFRSAYEDFDSTATYLTLVGGGGAAVMVTPRFSVDADARAFYWQGREPVRWMRLSGAVTYRF